jgi:phosphoglycolate phosphatase
MTQAHDLVLFDLDGTLSDPLEGIGRSINYALEHYGFRPLEFSEIAAYVGPPIDETFQRITRLTGAKEIKGLVVKYRERYSDVGYSENVLYAGVAEALRSLSEANVVMAVCTSKRKDFAQQILEMFALDQHFRFVDGGEVGVHKCQQIEMLLAKNSISKSSLMVGDRAVDIIAARRNGLHAGAVLWGYGPHSELANEQPNYFFSTPGDLSKLVGLTQHSSGLATLAAEFKR